MVILITIDQLNVSWAKCWSRQGH